MRSTVTFEHYEKRRLKKVAASCQPGSILDIGYAQHPNSYLPGRETVGLDIDLPSRASGYSEEISGDVHQIGDILADRTFDNIIAAEFIEHLEAPYEFLRTLRNHLDQNGRLIITTPNAVSWPCVMFEWLMSRRYYYTRDHTYYFTPRWVVRMLENTGYEVTRVAGVGFLMPLVTVPSPASLSYQTLFVARPKQ